MRWHFGPCWLVPWGLLAICALPPSAHAEGGTWPPIGQLVGGSPRSTAVRGNYAFVAASSAFTVLDLSDPAAPGPVGYCGTPGEAEVRSQETTFLLPFNLAPGSYDLFISVGTRSGTPEIALPLPDSDGQRRYRLGRITVGGA